MGGRLLRSRMLAALDGSAEIETRLDAVAELQSRRRSCAAELRKTLSGILDLERLLAKVTLGTATPRELLALGRSLARVPALRSHLAQATAARLAVSRERLDRSPKCATRMLGAIADEPPVNLADGGMIRDGFHPELDELRDITRNSKAVHRRRSKRGSERAPASLR